MDWLWVLPGDAGIQKKLHGFSLKYVKYVKNIYQQNRQKLDLTISTEKVRDIIRILEDLWKLKEPFKGVIKTFANKIKKQKECFLIILFEN